MLAVYEGQDVSFMGRYLEKMTDLPYGRGLVPALVAN